MGKRYHYLYRVEFPTRGWYYYGIHSTNRLDDGYSGSPHTHRDKWENYDWNIVPVEFFDTREECAAMEYRVIKHTLNDPRCLNESCGMAVSEEASRIGRMRGRETQKRIPGFYARIFARQDPVKRAEHLLKGQRKSVLVRRNKIVLVHPDGTEEKFDSQKDACLKYGLNQGKISEVLNQRRPHHKKFTAYYQHG